MLETARHTKQLEIRQIDSLASINPDDWNRLVNQDNPFLQYDFLNGLERFDCLTEHNWFPCHLTVNADNLIVGAVPLYYKTDSYGEFVFDWSWADAYQRAGGTYYPKLVSAIPFTPVCGPRMLIHPDYNNSEKVRSLLVDSIKGITESGKLSSFHCLFPAQTDVESFSQHDLLMRKTCQFHWYNQNYRDFKDFLDTLVSKKRKQIKRERNQVHKDHIEIEILHGHEISERQWSVFYEFYCSTFHRRWGSPRLTLDFFQGLSDNMPRNTLLILAKNGHDYVAGAFAMLGGNTLYGRHWGCNARFPNLHFELCYYQTIEYCIKHGLNIIDAGVQGEHKLSRGFRPLGLWSCHWIRHPGFRAAIRDYLSRETPEVDAYITELDNHLPFKSGP